MDALSEDMAMVEVTEEDAEYMTERRCKIRCGDPCREKPKEDEEDHCLPSAPYKACHAIVKHNLLYLYNYERITSY